MGRLIDLFKSDMKMAARTVKSGFKTYFSLFVALFLIQTLFGIVGISESNSRSAERDAIVEKYDCHIELTNLNDADHYYLVNAEGRMLDPYFEVLDYGIVNGSHTTGIRFLGDVEDQMASFLLDFEEIFERGAVCNRTPLYEYEVGNAAESIRYVVLLIFMAGISWILLSILNNIRMNHFKFGYGIYMTFGADFKRLSRIIVSEMLYILLWTYLPAMLVSETMVAIMTIVAGGKLYFSLMPLLGAFLIPLLVMLFAGVFSVRYMASRRPSEVLMAQDNTNHVTSPRRTKMIFAQRFPLACEALSLWRFRKYILRLTASTTFFALLFTCGIYVVTFYNQTVMYPQAQYTVSLAVPDDAFAQTLNRVEGVTALSSDKTEASFLNSHILLSDKQVLSAEGFEKPSYAEGMLATDQVVYRPVDDGLPSALTQYYGYDISGNPNRILKDRDSIILSDSIASNSVLNLDVGDTVYIAMSGTQTEEFFEHEAYDSDHSLRLRLKYYSFVYRAFTVAAIIHDEPDRSGLCVYLPKDIYTDMTGATVTDWSVYVDSHLSDSEFESADQKVRSMVDEHLTATLRDHETRTYQKLALSCNNAEVYSSIFFLILALVPLVWFFSLILFNRKRQVEFDVYRALGAERGMIRRLFLQDGIFYALAAGILYALTAPLCTYGLFNVLTADWFYILFLPSYLDKAVYLNQYPALWVYLTGIMLSVLSAFLACYVSYRSYSGKQSDHISENFSEEE